MIGLRKIPPTYVDRDFYSLGSGDDAMRKLDGPAELANNGWQKYCTEILNECVGIESTRRAIEWDDARIQLLRLLPPWIRRSRTMIA